MKKIILTSISVIAIATLVFISCKSKNDSDAITPTYKEEGTGTGGNPNITNVTTTGTVATTSTANQNSSMTGVGQGGTWSSVGCSGQTCLSVSNSNTGTTVTVCFATVPTAGTYQLVSSQAQLSSGPNKAFMTVNNPTGQPTGSNWYSSGGTIVITISGSSITGTFANIPCTQSGSAFPVVTVTGQVGCL